MSIDPGQKLSHVAVLGAAGKMGSGITLLAALEMARLKLQPSSHGKTFILHAVDSSEMALQGLMQYLRSQVQRHGERQIVSLRQAYAFRKDLSENQEIIQQYLWDVMSMVFPVTGIAEARGAGCVFEAVSEDPQLKVKLMLEMKQQGKQTPWFFTNTSSIPITWLDQQATLDGNIIGLHFYNPPAVQKLVEVAAAKNTRPEIHEMALHLARVFGKKVAISADVPGFIGNGHFMRELLMAIAMSEKLAQELPLAQAICQVNTISQDYLIRPMGIFQLMDYVGIDVCRHILKVMDPHFPDEQFRSKLLDFMYEKGILGGQHADGIQKPGFFQYSRNQPVEIYDFTKDHYIPLDSMEAFCQERLGPLPASWMPWKALIRHPQKQGLLQEYFSQLQQISNRGAQLALDYLKQSRSIAMKLVEQEVAASPQVVNLVMETGFYHAYGPINDFIK